MFGNAGATPPTDAGDLPGGSVNVAADGQDSLSEAVPEVPAGLASPAGSSLSSANDESVGHWLEELPERSWDQSPGE
ncbi:MAG TPA: hypothetical protein VLO31_08070 [Cryobacterium sp.]|nr:hypothetical protein [Cryobacterium sp.]